MKLFLSIFKFYVNASVHVALAVIAFTGVTILELDLDISKSMWGFVFFGTIFSYNFVKYFEVVGLKSINVGRSIRSIRAISILSFVLVTIFGAQQSIKVLILIFLLGSLTFFYAIPLLNRSNLRNLVGLKIFVVSLVWSGVTVLLPVIGSSIDINADIWITFIQRFLMVLVLTLPFEIRDLHYDVSRLKTLPQQLGLRKTKILGNILLVIIIVLDGFKDDISHAHFFSLLFFCALTSGFLIASEEKQSRYFASFWVESLPILWLFLMLLMSELF